MRLCPARQQSRGLFF